MERYKKGLILALVLLPVIWAFKNFWDISNPLVWGDAPYFFRENLNELFNIPFAWDIRNSNFGSSQLLTLWLFTPTFLMGFFYKIFGLSHELSIRLIFYLPFAVFGLSGIWLTLSKYKLSMVAKSCGTIFYLLNSYSVLLLDGGQIGVLLSYGLFPFCLYLFLNYLEKTSLSNFLLSLFFHFLIFNSDLRTALMLVLLEVNWGLFLINKNRFKRVLNSLAIYLIVLILSGFWVVPFISGLKTDGPSQSSSGSNEFIQLTNSFYLFQPHFPENDFGNLNKTPVYFIFITIILFLIFLKKEITRHEINLGILFLILVFLSKGSNPPIGEIYTFLINKIPLGSAFRDSSKFYIPGFLIGSILMGLSIDSLKQRVMNVNFTWTGLIYVFILASIFPVFTSNLTGVLGNSPDKNEYNLIHDLIKSDNQPLRTLWFREKPPLGFSDWNHPPVNANLLFQERPIASMIEGDFDLFGFLHNENISKWYELLGIKYIFYPPYERDKNLTEEEKRDRGLFESFIAKIPYLERVNISIPFPVYKTDNPSPKIFGQQKILFVIGGEEIYEKFFKLKNFKLENNATVFLESCKVNPEIIFSLNPAAFALVTSNDANDLYMSFFCRSFIPTSKSKIKEWAINDSSKYLNWKAQLLQRGVRNYDYDYDLGLAYSTKTGEKMEFRLETVTNQNYYLPIRFLTASQSAGIKLSFEGREEIVKSKSPNKLEWKIFGPISLPRGQFGVTLTNLGGTVILNTLGVITQDEYDQKKNQIDRKLNNLIVFNDESDTELNKFLESKTSIINYKLINPAKYEVNLSSSSSAWLVFSERFDKDWQLVSKSDTKTPLPFYSMINGYYLSDMKSTEGLELRYRPQQSVLIGLWITLGGLLLVGFLLILNIIKQWRS